MRTFFSHLFLHKSVLHMSDYDHTVNKNQMAELFGKSVKTIGDWIGTRKIK